MPIVITVFASIRAVVGPPQVTKKAATSAGTLTRRALARLGVIVLAIGTGTVGGVSPANAYQRAPSYVGDAASGSGTTPGGLTVTLSVTSVDGANVVQRGPNPDVAADATAGGADPTFSPASMNATVFQALTAGTSVGQTSTYQTSGTITVTFSRPVRNPRLHFSNLGASDGGLLNTASLATRLRVTGGVPSAPTLSALSGWTDWTVSTTQISANNVNTHGEAPNACTDSSGFPRVPFGCGSVQVNGTDLTAVTLTLDMARDQAGLLPPTAPTTDTFEMAASVDEDLANAPASYGGASHIASNLTAGASVTVDNVTTLTSGPAAPVQASDTNDANPTFPRLGPDRIGQSYVVAVPVAGVTATATMAGWIDFDRNGTFDTGERTEVSLASGATSASLSWTVGITISPGASWARFRLSYDSAQVALATGLADSGEVEDYALTITAATVITSPANGSVVNDSTPAITGTNQPGDAITVMEGAQTICTATVAGDSSWTCTAGTLPDGSHTITATATNGAGDSTASQPVTFTIETALSISAPESDFLGSAPPGGTISGAIGTVQVFNPGGFVAWTATVEATNFTSGAETITNASASYWSGTATASTGSATFTPGQPTAGQAQPMNTPQIAFSQSLGTGSSSASWIPTIIVTVPLSAVGGTYTGTVTHSIA